MKPHIQYLVNAEIVSHARLWFQRTGENTICISTVGYRHMEQNHVEKKLLELGCKYDFKKSVNEFDDQSGRTFTHFTEPKGDLK